MGRQGQSRSPMQSSISIAGKAAPHSASRWSDVDGGDAVSSGLVCSITYVIAIQGCWRKMNAVNDVEGLVWMLQADHTPHAYGSSTQLSEFGWAQLTAFVSRCSHQQRSLPAQEKALDTIQCGNAPRHTTILNLHCCIRQKAAHAGACCSRKCTSRLRPHW